MTNGLSRVYHGIVNFVDKFVPPKMQPLWQHPAGPKTIFFWGPLVKWGLVFAGIGDLSRSADKISVNQSISLAITGLLWSRYSLVIIPKNYSLFMVNMFVALTQAIQAARAYEYQMSLNDQKKSTS